MCSSDRLALIAGICAKRPSLNRINMFAAPSTYDEREEAALAARHNDDESIADAEPEDGAPMVSPELARVLKTERYAADRTDDLILTPGERKQIEEDKWRNRRRFALWIPPRSIADLLHA